MAVDRYARKCDELTIANADITASRAQILKARNDVISFLKGTFEKKGKYSRRFRRQRLGLLREPAPESADGLGGAVCPQVKLKIIIGIQLAMLYA